MADNKELFSGLDSLVFDSESTIDIADFNKKADSTDDNSNATDDKDAPNSKTGDKVEEGIDPDEFFKAAKEKADAGESTDDVDTTDDSDDSSANTDSALKTWADYFKENTLLADEDLVGFDGSVEALTEAFQKREIRVGMEMVDDYKSQLPAEIKFLADNWEEGVPLNELINIKSNQLRYSKVTDEKLEESIDTQKAVYAEYLRKTTKYSEAKIEKEVTRLVDLDDIQDEAKEALVELKKFEAEAEETLKKETKKQREIRVEENAKTIKQYEKVVKETKEVIPGLRLSEKEQLDVLNKIVNPIGVNGYGEPVSYISDLRSEDPYAFDLAVTYLATLTTDKKTGKAFSDWSKIVKVGETKAVKGLESVLNTPAPKSAKDGIKTSGKQSLMDLLEKNKGIFKK